MTARDYLYKYMDNRESGELYGVEIIDAVRLATGRPKIYSSTVLAYLRDYVDIAGAELVCINRKESRYYYTAGHKIAGYC